MSIFGSDKIGNESQIDYNRRMNRENRIRNETIDACINSIGELNMYSDIIQVIHELRKLKK